MGKWATLAASAGSAAYGLRQNERADREFDELEAICDSDPDRCQSRNADGSFTDEGLERHYQEILKRDGRARTALLAGQVALAASVVLFILDLDSRTPPDIPYDPPVRLELGPDGPSLAVRFPLGARRAESALSVPGHRAPASR